jgi:hypothetical protein
MQHTANERALTIIAKRGYQPGPDAKNRCDQSKAASGARRDDLDPRNQGATLIGGDCVYRGPDNVQSREANGQQIHSQRLVSASEPDRAGLVDTVLER